MPDNFEVWMKAGLDSSGVEKGAKKMADAVEKGAAKSKSALEKFGFSADGVLTKLARQLSLTDIAATAVFAGIAKGKQILDSSVKAYEDQQRLLRSMGEEYDGMIDRIDASNRAIVENNRVIGENASYWVEWGKNVETAISGAMAKAARFIELNKEAANIRTTNTIQRQFMDKGLGAPSVSFNTNAPAQPFVGPMPPANLDAILAAERQAASRRDQQLDRLIDALTRGQKSYAAPIGGPDTGFGFDWNGNQFQGQPPMQFNTYGPSYNEDALKAYEKAQEAGKNFSQEFAGNLQAGLTNALFAASDFGSALENIMKQTFANILSSALTGGITSLLTGGNFFTGIASVFTGNSTSGRSMPQVTAATQAQARSLAPALRREAMLGRGI